MAYEKKFHNGALSDFEDEMISRLEAQQTEIETLKSEIEVLKQ